MSLLPESSRIAKRAETPNINYGRDQNINGDGTLNIISGGQVHFGDVFNSAERNPHRTLWDAVGNIGASHNSEQQYERGEVLKGTRERALDRIFTWVDSPDEPPFFWLTGPAGVGKTAIAITVAKSCEEKKRLVASFFCFRADSRRNNPSGLFLTVAYGLATTVPLLRKSIEQRISRDPRILDSCMEDQFRELVVQPCLQLLVTNQASRSDTDLRQELPLPMPSASDAPSAVGQWRPPIWSLFLLSVFIQTGWWRLVLILYSTWLFIENRDRHQGNPGQAPNVTGGSITPRGVPIIQHHELSREASLTVDAPRGDRSGPDRKDNLSYLEGHNLVIIDGLDECGDEQIQKRILSTIRSAYGDSQPFPLRFLICSRSESWLRHAFDAQPLRSLHERVVLEGAFLPNKDIIRYYEHHFQEIRDDPQYEQVKFPTPWPSKADFETLLERTDNQFAYAATAVRFIKQAYTQPVEQLQVILTGTPPRRPGVLPFEQLDALYKFILSVNPHSDEVISVLAAILVIPDPESTTWLFSNGASGRSPGCIELVLGLPSGQVALTLRGMHSVLDIRGSCDEIRLPHNSFREFLLDPNRSGPFYINESSWIHAIAWMWLRNLSTKKIRSYSSGGQLWDKDNEPFFRGWLKFCRSIPAPTRDLLGALSDVDFTAAFILSGYGFWESFSERLVSWVQEYRSDLTARENEGPSEIRDHAKAGRQSPLKVNQHLSYNNRQCGVEAPSHETDNRRDVIDLLEGLVHKLENCPQCHHLEWPPGVSPPEDVVNWIVLRASRYSLQKTRLDGLQPSPINKICITECHCNLSGGNESCDPSHVAYQQACLRLVKASVSLFGKLSRSVAPWDHNTIRELNRIFLNLIYGAVLGHCPLDMELILLCQTFFASAKACLIMDIDSSDQEKVKKNLFQWFETFPERFATEGEALKVLFLGLPWEQWSNFYSGSLKAALDALSIANGSA